MPKMKTKRAAAKRFKATGGGRIRRSTAGKQHLMRGKSANRLRGLKKNSMVSDADEPRMPNGSIGYRWADEEKGHWNLELEDKVPVHLGGLNQSIAIHQQQLALAIHTKLSESG